MLNAHPRSRSARLVLALALAGLGLCGVLVCAPARSVGMLGFFFINQAMQDMATRAVGGLSGNAPLEPPNWAATLGTAELLNDKLPMESKDGFMFVLARAPAPAALEIKAKAPGATPPTGPELDKAWGPGLIQMFCGADTTLWTRWIAMGGSVGLEVVGSDGELIRRYGVTRADCAALRRQAEQ